MKLLKLTLFTLLLLMFACKPGDFKLSAPTATLTGSSKVNFDHTAFTNTSCIQCHENKRPITTPIHGDGKDCINCHTANLNAQGLRTWLNVSNFSHNPMPTSCVSCHESKRPTTISPHTKGNWGEKADCVTCHTHPAWKPAKFDHIKPLTSCIECHRTPTKDDRPAPKDNHPAAFYNQIDCIQCHTNSNNSKRWTDVTFNHRTHTPAPTSCMNCHEVKRPLSHTVLPKISGMDKADCNSCHTSNIDWAQHSAFDHETAKPTSCIGCHQSSTPATQTIHPSIVGNYFKIDCVKCHTYDKSTSPRSWAKIIFDQRTHSPAPTKCIDCHKTINNSLPTNNSHASGGRANSDCAVCHTFDTTNKWKNLTKFNHIATDPQERCDGCHTSSLPTMIAKPATHIATTLDCKSCHSSTAWKPASYSHATTDTNCMSCHNGTTATGKPTTHVTTTLNCSSCHTQTAWKPATYTHTASDTNCLSCHNGTTATGKPVSHTLSGQCSACHTQTNWTKSFKTTYSHTNSIVPVSNTRAHPSITSCTKCHSTTTDSVNWIYTTTSTQTTIIPKGTCAGCHLDKYNNAHGTLKTTTSANCLSCHHTGYQGF